MKFALFEVAEPLSLILEGQIDSVGTAKATLRVKRKDQTASPVEQVTASDHVNALDVLMDCLEKRAGRAALVGVGHRVVHGGPAYSKPIRVTTDIVKELGDLSSFDPEHLPNEISMMEAMMHRHPGVPQIACFDTAFHHDLPRAARLLSIPRRYEAQGVRRYGFHGLSYTFIVDELRRLAGDEVARGRLILAHLGSGASLAAVRNGKPVDTTMSFTPTGGIPMSSRSGDLDPGLIWYLARNDRMSAKQINRMVNFESGLLGISETSPDMHELLDREADDIRCAEAVAAFCYQIRKYVGAYAAALGGLDTLIFTGGIGENAPLIRARICENLDFLGIALDHEHNLKSASRISTKDSQVIIRVIPTDEEIIIARSVARVLETTGSC